jgi:hypothetical protein
MTEQKSKEPNANEMAYPMSSEYAKHPNSPAATGADPQAQAGDPAAPGIPRPGGGGAPGTGDQQPVMPSEEARHQWAGAKGPAESGKP